LTTARHVVATNYGRGNSGGHVNNNVADQPDEIPNPFASGDVLFGFGPSWREQSNPNRSGARRAAEGPTLSVDDMIMRLRSIMTVGGRPPQRGVPDDRTSRP
jgi:hypothetical protein